MKNKRSIIIKVLSAYIAFVFIQSLFFKFSGSPETQHIFSTLDTWATNTFGISGLFLPPGIFNAYIIGTAELVASIFLIAALFLKNENFTIIGATLSFGVISGAIFFHLFTPLGINVQNDGGVLFYMACGVWVSAITLLLLHKDTLLNKISKK